MENIFGINKKYWRKNQPEGVHPLATSQATPPLGRALASCGSHRPPPTLIPTLYIHIRGEKNRGEEFIAFYDTEPPPPPVLPRGGWSGVHLGLRRGEFIVIIITNPSPSIIPWFSPPEVSNSFVGLLDSDGIGWDLSCNQVILIGLDA